MSIFHPIETLNKLRDDVKMRRIARPLPVTKRKRRLTLPFDTSQKEQPGFRAKMRIPVTKPKIELQHASLFFRLPFELRDIIYQDYVGVDKVWIGMTSKGDLRGLTLQYCQPAGAEVVEPVAQALEVLPLLLTCRRVYSELINLIYSLTFAFPDPISFFAFSAMLVPHRFHAIQKVHLGPLDTKFVVCMFDYLHQYWGVNSGFHHGRTYRRIRNSSIVRFHNALPRAKWSEERDKTFWQQVCRILSTMGGLTRLTVHIGIMYWDDMLRDHFVWTIKLMAIHPRLPPGFISPISEVFEVGAQNPRKIEIEYVEPDFYWLNRPLGRKLISKEECEQLVPGDPAREARGTYKICIDIDKKKLE